MNSRESGSVVDEARLLMPWYLTNKLSAKEQQLVNEALELSPELRAEFLQEEKMMRLVKENKNLLELTAPDTTGQRLDKVLSRIEHEQPSPAPRKRAPETSGSGWWSKLFNSGTFGVDWLSPANAVFASLLAVQAAVLGYAQLSGAAVSETNTYESASVEKPAVAGVATNPAKSLFLIAFQDEAKHHEVRDFLSQWSARIISGPDKQDMFSVELDTGGTQDAVAFADLIMQQSVENKVPVAFIGSQYNNAQ